MANSKYNYRRLLSETEFLKVKRRSLQVTGIDLASIDFLSNTLRFQCNSVTTRGKRYTVLIHFDAITPDEVMSSTNSLADVLKAAGMKVSCSCPAWLYWGFKYKSWRYNYGLFEERRFPKVRNPALRGTCCKHVRAIMMAFPFWSRSIASRMVGYWTEAQRSAIEDSLRKVMRSEKFIIGD